MEYCVRVGICRKQGNDISGLGTNFPRKNKGGTYSSFIGDNELRLCVNVKLPDANFLVLFFVFGTTGVSDVDLLKSVKKQILRKS